MELWQYFLLAALGLVAGIINVLAGGGSLLTLPAMVLMGLDGPVANGTNRVAIFAQNIVAVTGFRSKGFSEPRLSLTLALATLPGAIAGACLGTLIRGVVFNRVLACVMIGVMISMALKWRPSTEKRHPVWGHICMVGVGFYGGFIQAGVGFLIIATLHGVMGLDLVRVNMHKVFVVGVFTFAALMVFALNGQVLWLTGAILAVGNSIGGWIGSQLSVNKGEKFIRVVLYIALTAMALKLLIG
ncbi:MAG: sulfite exporter TauE/SafE family protein [Verrucomicrobiota bacterium]